MVKSDEVAHPERLIARAIHALQTTVAKMGMCALSANPSSPLLWAHYAQSHTGLCVQLQPHQDMNTAPPILCSRTSSNQPATRCIADASQIA